MTPGPGFAPRGFPHPLAVLAVIVVLGVALRLLGIHWLVGAGPTADFSFHPDDQRFIEAVRSFGDKAALGGYIPGMVTQLFAVQTLLGLLHLDANPLVVLRAISQAYAAMTIVLTYCLSFALLRSHAKAVLAAGFLALSPLHIVNSNFGTADVAAVALLYAMVLSANRYFRANELRWFAATFALCGFAISVKFFVPLLAGALVILATEPRGKRGGRILTGILVGIGAFAVGTAFNYTLRDFAELVRMLQYDNLSIAEGKSPFEQVGLYAFDLTTALSLPVAALVLAALPRAWVATRDVLRAKAPGSLRRALVVLLVVLAAHFLMICTAGIHAARHNLAFVPALCIVAASAFVDILAATRIRTAVRIASVAVLALYLGCNAAGLQQLYRHDVRWQLAEWADAANREQRVVRSTSFYTPVRGAVYDREFDLAGLRHEDVFLTCDLEFARYLRQADAGALFHAKGGQARLDFFRDFLLRGDRQRVVAYFTQRRWTPEQALIARGVLPSLQTFVPSVCIVLGDESDIPEIRQEALRRDVLLPARML